MASDPRHSGPPKAAEPPQPDVSGTRSGLGHRIRLARHFSFRQLQVFDAIARVRNFSRAADELHLAQPTVSTQMKRLADALGMPLFEQIGRDLYLTEAGRVLHKACGELFDVLARLEMDVADLKGLKQGSLRIAVVTTAKYFAPEILGAFCQKFPGIDVALTVTNRRRVLERIAANEDDLYIIGSVPEDLNLQVHPFAPNPLYVMAHPQHPLVGQGPVPLSALAEEEFILREPGSGIRGILESVFAERGFRPRVRMELGSNEAIKHAILGRLGISVLSLHTVALDAPSRSPAILNVEGFPLERQWNVVYPREKVLSVTAKAFQAFLDEQGTRLAASMARTAARHLPRPGPKGKRSGSQQRSRRHTNEEVSAKASEPASPQTDEG